MQALRGALRREVAVPAIIDGKEGIELVQLRDDDTDVFHVPPVPAAAGLPHLTVLMGLAQGSIQQEVELVESKGLDKQKFATACGPVLQPRTE